MGGALLSFYTVNVSSWREQTLTLPSQFRLLGPNFIFHIGIFRFTVHERRSRSKHCSSKRDSVFGQTSQSYCNDRLHASVLFLTFFFNLSHYSGSDKVKVLTSLNHMSHSRLSVRTPWLECPAFLTSLKLNFPSKSSSTSLIMFLRPRWVCGAPSFSIISFSSIRSMKPSLPVSYLKENTGDHQGTYRQTAPTLESNPALAPLITWLVTPWSVNQPVTWSQFL